MEEKETLWNNEIREGIQVPEAILRSFMLMYTLWGTKINWNSFLKTVSSYFLILKVPTSLDPLVIILLTFIMYFEIYYKKPNGFNMAFLN